MIDIVSKGSGPRREDERARKLIEANRPVIEGLANRLTNGAWSARNRVNPDRKPEPQGLVIHAARATTTTEPPRPFARIALNGRVSLVDENTAKQLHHLGDIRRRDGSESFRLATKENGFFSPVDPDIAAALADLDGLLVEGRDGERALIEAIGTRLRI